jgi:hypothetical protein
MLDRTSKPDWKTLSAAKRLEIMEPHRANGASASEMALLFVNCTRNSVIGALTRARRHLLGGDSNRPRTASGVAAKRGGTGNPGQPKAKAIVSRARRRAEGVRTRVSVAPPLPLPEEPEQGVDVTRLIGLADRRIGHECAWVHGDPLQPGSGFCGKPTVHDSEWCEQHHRRVYSARA